MLTRVQNRRCVSRTLDLRLLPGMAGILVWIGRSTGLRVIDRYPRIMASLWLWDFAAFLEADVNTVAYYVDKFGVKIGLRFEGRWSIGGFFGCEEDLTEST